MAFAEKTETKAEATVLSLSSNVIDEVSGEASVGLEVKAAGSDLKTYTDFDGHFVFDNLKSGECKLIASYTSYTKNEKLYRLNRNRIW